MDGETGNIAELEEELQKTGTVPFSAVIKANKFKLIALLSVISLGCLSGSIEQDWVRCVRCSERWRVHRNAPLLTFPSPPSYKTSPSNTFNDVTNDVEYGLYSLNVCESRTDHRSANTTVTCQKDVTWDHVDPTDSANSADPAYIELEPRHRSLASGVSIVAQTNLGFSGFALLCILLAPLSLILAQKRASKGTWGQAAWLALMATSDDDLKSGAAGGYYPKAAMILYFTAGLSGLAGWTAFLNRVTAWRVAEAIKIIMPAISPCPSSPGTGTLCYLEVSYEAGLVLAVGATVCSWLAVLLIQAV